LKDLESAGCTHSLPIESNSDWRCRFPKIEAEPVAAPSGPVSLPAAAEEEEEEEEREGGAGERESERGRGGGARGGGV
jgi:hypothetical protein